ncbi:MAG: DNA polymerase III subunit delta [Bdellovibrionaceae bacterium]|nr:DNA polymerase III subunit delta [Pseudobdellovibrionaceae bacterium]
MPMVEASHFYEELQHSRLAPLYFLFGEEPYLLQQAVDRVKWAVLNEATIDFNYNQYFAADAEAAVVRDAVELLPMMAERRLVVLREAQELTEQDWNELTHVLRDPVPTTVFVLTMSQVDKRKKVVKMLMEKAVSVEFKKPYENQIPSWIHYIAGSLNLEISEDAVHLLHRLAGNHLGEIENELRKLSDYVSGRRIEVADVARVVSRSREESVFEFARAVGEANKVKALEQLVRLLDQGQPEILIVANVARHIRILLKIKQGMEEGLYGAKLASFAQVPSFFVNQYVDQARHWSVPRLQKMLSILSETDRALKSSPLSSHIWLENMVIEGARLLASK